MDTGHHLMLRKFREIDCPVIRHDGRGLLKPELPLLRDRHTNRQRVAVFILNRALVGSDEARAHELPEGHLDAVELAVVEHGAVPNERVQYTLEAKRRNSQTVLKGGR
jgi:hypothetical protein